MGWGNIGDRSHHHYWGSLGLFGTFTSIIIIVECWLYIESVNYIYKFNISKIVRFNYVRLTFGIYGTIDDIINTKKK